VLDVSRRGYVAILIAETRGRVWENQINQNSGASHDGHRSLTEETFQAMGQVAVELCWWKKRGKTTVKGPGIVGRWHRNYERAGPYPPRSERGNLEDTTGETEGRRNAVRRIEIFHLSSSLINGRSRGERIQGE